MRIYVGGLSYNTNADTLRQAFEAYGTVQDVSIVEDRFSGQSKGFGFVEMADTTEANNAIARLNGNSLDGRNLTVNEARPREERGGGNGRRPGGGYSGGGGRY